jgi:hypothetical protein
MFSGCQTVSYKEHTKIVECDFAIMLTKVKSKKGSSAFEIGKYVDKCYDKLRERQNKK